VRGGRLQGGSVSSLGAADGATVDVASKRKGVSLRVRVSSIANDAGELALTYRGSSSARCRQTISIWNYKTGSWRVVDRHTVGRSEVDIPVTVSGGVGDLVRGRSGDGDVQLQVSCTSLRSPRFTLRADLLSLTA
jgi:hypothetical protein